MPPNPKKAKKSNYYYSSRRKISFLGANENPTGKEEKSNDHGEEEEEESKHGDAGGVVVRSSARIREKKQEVGEKDAPVVNGSKKSTRKKEGLTGKKEGLTGKKEGSTGKNEGSTGKKEGSTGKKEESTRKKEGSTRKKGGSTRKKEGSTGKKKGSTRKKEGDAFDFLDTHQQETKSVYYSPPIFVKLSPGITKTMKRRRKMRGKEAAAESATVATPTRDTPVKDKQKLVTSIIHTLSPEHDDSKKEEKPTREVPKPRSTRKKRKRQA